MIREEGSRTTVLLGTFHGRVDSTLYAKENGDSSLFDGIMLNSPFFDFNKSWFVKKCIRLSHWWVVFTGDKDCRRIHGTIW